jgi:hypothetical protein
MNDLKFTQGRDNVAGLVDFLSIAASEDILTLPALASAASLKTAATDIAFKTGKCFKQLYFTDETAKVETKGIGERDGMGRESVLEGRYPAYGTELEDFIRLCQNTPSVLAFRLKRNGKLYLLGVTQFDQASTVLSLAIPCYFQKGDSTTGDTTASQNGAVLGWKYSSAHGPIEYAGTINLVPAS